jgi:pimeloyl-ACP methyl ester carboxylesterase
VRFVAIHGLGCSASQGWPSVRKAIGREHQLVALRLHGADGPTSAPPDAWGLRAQAARLAPHVTADTVLVGHSMGGALAVRVAEVASPRALVLVEPHVVPRAGFVVRPTLALGPEPTPEARAAFLREMGAFDTGEGSYAEWIARWDWRVFHAMSGELAQGDGAPRSWLDALASFRFPVRLLWGAKSADACEDEHRAALAKLGIDATLVPGSAHFVPSEQPRALADGLRGLAAEA